VFSFVLAAMWGLWDTQDDVPPPPPRSSVFVMRNGRYEPQNLMPVMPRPDILDFDGFVLRRGAASGRPPVRPPDLRQASLVKSCISLRKATMQVKLHGAHPSPSPKSGASGPVILSFIFDAMKPGVLSLYLRVTEVEHNDTQPGGPVQRSIELTETSSEPAGSDGEPGKRTALPLHEMRFEKGLGQVYESPPLDLDDFPQESWRFDVARPRQIPLAVRLLADTEVQSTSTEGEDEAAVELVDRSAHYTYVSLQKVGGASAESPTADTSEAQGDDRCPWSAHVVGQKLEHSGQCFVLHEVFGAGPTDGRTNDASSRRPSLADHDVEGNTDCVICLSEPRDTAVLPCRHMCFCSYCAGIVRLQCDRCPVCRQKVQSLLQFKREDLENNNNKGPPAPTPKAAARSG